MTGADLKDSVDNASRVISNSLYPFSNWTWSEASKDKKIVLVPNGYCDQASFDSLDKEIIVSGDSGVHLPVVKPNTDSLIFAGWTSNAVSSNGQSSIFVDCEKPFHPVCSSTELTPLFFDKPLVHPQGKKFVRRVVDTIREYSINDNVPLGFSFNIDFSDILQREAYDTGFAAAEDVVVLHVDMSVTMKSRIGTYLYPHGSSTSAPSAFAGWIEADIAVSGDTKNSRTLDLHLTNTGKVRDMIGTFTQHDRDIEPPTYPESTVHADHYIIANTTGTETSMHVDVSIKKHAAGLQPYLSENFGKVLLFVFSAYVVSMSVRRMPGAV